MRYIVEWALIHLMYKKIIKELYFNYAYLAYLSLPKNLADEAIDIIEGGKTVVITSI